MSTDMNRMKVSRVVASAVVLAGALLSGASAGSAQEVVGVSGVIFENFQFADPEGTGIDNVSLVSIPFGVSAPLIERLSVDLRSSFASGRMTRADGTDVSLTGLTDTEFRANYEVVPQFLTISAAVLLPTGQSKQSAEESELAGLVAADLLPFRVSNWGSGGGAGLISTLTMPVGDFGVGVSAGYTMGREFEPLEEDEVGYRPGSEMRLRVAIDRNVGSTAKASLIVGGQLYQDDEMGGSSVFTPGNRFEATGSLAFRVGQLSSAVAYAGMQHRGEGRLLDWELKTPAQDLFNAGVGFRIPRGSSTFQPLADVRIFRRSDGVDQGYLTSLGASVEVPVGGIVLLPTLKGRFGKALLWDGAESAVRGADLGLGIRYRTR